MSDTTMSRRGFVSAAGAAGVLAACGFAGKTVFAEEAEGEKAAPDAEPERASTGPTWWCVAPAVPA